MTRINYNNSTKRPTANDLILCIDTNDDNNDSIDPPTTEHYYM